MLRTCRACAAGLFALLFAAYANHFHNGFHFDDSQANQVAFSYHFM